MNIDLVESMLAVETPEAKAYVEYFQNSEFSKILKLGFVPNAKLKNQYIKCCYFEIVGLLNTGFYALNPTVVINSVKTDTNGNIYKGHNNFELSPRYFASEILSKTEAMWQLC